MRTIRILACIALLAVLTACGLDNTMYNARKYFTSAQVKPLNTNGKPNAQAIDEYTKCIQKCGIIISRSKHGSRLDNAVFLMAKALYFKGNSAFQAKDQFENLIKGFPDSPFVPEAHIYIARIMREINQPKEAEKLLDGFIRDPKFNKEHPQALLLLADFAIKDKDYTRAQFWLDKIIREYPKTREFKQAFFLFGKNYYEQKDYAASREAFNKMRSSRRIDKSMKHDASYYIALNNLELGDTDAAMKEIRNLVKAENRPEKMALVKLLYGRILMADEQYPKALEEMDSVTKIYPRTEGAAASYYFLGEYYYYVKSDIAQAVTSYNRVRTEYSTSIYATPGQEKATALGFVNPRQNLNVETDSKTFLDYYYQAAESFAGTLALPDSAAACYLKVIAEKDSLKAVKDSLATVLGSFKLQRDSLMQVVAADSAKAAAAIQEPDLADSLKLAEELTASTDSLLVAADSTTSAISEEPPAPDPKAELDALRPKITTAENRMLRIDELIATFDTEVIPFALFAMGSLKHKLNQDDPENEAIMTRLQEEFSHSKYTKAFRALINDQPIKLVDPVEEQQEALLDSLFGMMETLPDSAVVALDSLTFSPIAKVKLAAQYRLGWYYSFESPDSAKAVPYLQEVLDDQDSGDYGTMVRRFYDGKHYLLQGPEVHQEEEDAADSLSTEIKLPTLMDGDAIGEGADSLQVNVSVPDSLNLFEFPTPPDSTLDSLQVTPQTSPPAPSDGEQTGKESQTETLAAPEAIKEEEPKLE